MGLQDSIDNFRKDQQDKAKEQAQLDAVTQSGDKVAVAVERNTVATRAALKDVKGQVEVTNTDLAKTQDISQVVDAINKANLTTFMSNEGLPQLAQNLNELSSKTQDLQDKLENEGLKKMSDQLGVVVKKLDDVSKILSKSQVTVDAKLQKTIDNLTKTINAIDFNPSVQVTAPDTKVVTTPVDFKPVLSVLNDILTALNQTEQPELQIDLASVTLGLTEVRKAITGLRFPVPNFDLPFVKDGKSTQVILDSQGNVPITGNLTTSVATPSTIRNGQVTVAVTNTAVQLSAGVCVGVVVQALAGNAGNVVIGDSSVTTANGMQLQPGQATGVAIDNINKIYVNGTAGDGVCWIGS